MAEQVERFMGLMPNLWTHRFSAIVEVRWMTICRRFTAYPQGHAHVLGDFVIRTAGLRIMTAGGGAGGMRDAGGMYIEARNVLLDSLS